jgi:hypothetical protein
LLFRSNSYTLLSVTDKIAASWFSDTTGSGPRYPLQRLPIPTRVSLRVVRGDDYPALVQEFDDENRYQTAVVPDDLLDRFLKIKTPQQALKFAQRFGLLGVCEEHRPLPLMHGCPLEMLVNKGLDECRIVHREERLSTWSFYQDWITCVLSAAALIESGKRLGEDHRDAIKSGFWRPSYDALPAPTDQGVVAWALNMLLQSTDVRPFVCFDGAFKIAHGSSWPTMLGAVAMQLVLRITRQDELFVCDGCGDLISWNKRRPKLGQHTYCGACKKRGVDARERQRRSRQRRNGEQR